ncbi:MFS transporter [Bdellovibrio sp. qaytius]|nr:MFS transporter [Bdellovibrio sp. qaytius]
MMNTEEKNEVLNPTVVKLGVVSFFADIASEMLYPITPIFLTTILGASVTSVGIIEGVAESIASLLKTYSGAWSDSLSKRKPFILIGYLLAALSKPLIGASTSWLGVLSARALDRTGKGIRSAPRDALLAESVSPELRGAAFGWHRGMDTLGAAVGPLFALYLLSTYADNLRPLFYWAVVPGLLAVLVIFLIKEPPHTESRKKIENPFKLWPQFDPAFKKYIFSWGLFSLTNSSDVFLLLKAKQTGQSMSAVIIMYCAYNLLYAISSPYLGKLSDVIGRKKLMLSGLLIFILVYLGFGFATEAWQLWVLFLLYGLYMGATEGVGKAFAIDLAPKNLKATGVGILGTVTGLCTIVASTAAGFLWDHVGSSWTFFYGASGALLCACFLLFNAKRAS